MRRSRLAPAGPVNSANIDCAAVVIALRIRDKSRSPARRPKLSNDRHRVPRPIILTPGPSVHVDFACMRLNTGHKFTNR